VPVLRGVGASTISIHPDLAAERIREGVAAAVREVARGEFDTAAVRLPERFVLRLEYREAARAYRARFYPGVVVESDLVVRYEATEWLDVLTALMFIVY
jgi:D-amino peptidase